MTDRELNLYIYNLLQEYSLKHYGMNQINLKRCIKKQQKEFILNIIKYKVENNISLNVNEKVVLNYWMDPVSIRKDKKK